MLIWFTVKESRGLFWTFNEFLGYIRWKEFLDQLNGYSILWTTYTEISWGVSTLQHLLCLGGSRLLPHKRESKMTADFRFQVSQLRISVLQAPAYRQLWDRAVTSCCTALSCLSPILLTLQAWNLSIWEHHPTNSLKPCRQWSLPKWTTESIRN
jgi:hypothetical protein